MTLDRHNPTDNAANEITAEEGASGRRSSSRLELLTVAHAAALLVFSTWAFGGETDAAHLLIRWWGLPAVILTVLATWRRLQKREGLPPLLRWLWPLLLLDGLVLLSCLNPSLVRTTVRGAQVFVQHHPDSPWLSSARPDLSLRELWLFNAIYLTAFNVAIIVRRRRMLRALLLIATANTLVLAVFGTFQKLAHASGLFFGVQRSPNPAFFASFIYHNHWGALSLLSTAAALALLFHYSRLRESGGRRHSPTLFGLTATLLMAASVPLSTSRSCSVMLLLLLAGALFHWLRRIHRHARAGGRSPAVPAAIAVGAFLVGIVAIYLLGEPVIEARVDKTREQIEQIKLHGGLGGREQLYGDTWRMAREKIWFGWGLESYATVFQTFNQQVSVEGWVPFYAQAHSDWLQALAELGVAGTALVLLLGAVPLAALRRTGPTGALPGCLLAGCGLIALYAWVEFPFANPAVMLTFWLCFFTAIRYAQLDAHART